MPSRAIAAAAVSLAFAATAQAGYKVYSPYVEMGELEIEYRPSVTVDGDDAKHGEQVHLIGVGYGVTSWWFTELYGEWEREAGPGEEAAFEAFEWENRFQLTNPGENWVDFGILAEYERTDSGSAPDKIEIALLFAKNLGKFDLTYNLVFEREVGGGASEDVDLGHALQLKYRLDRTFEPGIEIFGEFGPIDNIAGFNEEAHYAGPIVEGEAPLGEGGLKLKYNAGYLFGLSDEAADGVIKAIIELEVPL